jgi:hypothetical protein
MIKIKARNAGNSMAIAKFRNAEVNHFVPKMVGHDLIRGSLDFRKEWFVVNRFSRSVVQRVFRHC